MYEDGNSEPIAMFTIEAAPLCVVIPHPLLDMSLTWKVNENIGGDSVKLEEFCAVFKTEEDVEAFKQAFCRA